MPFYKLSRPAASAVKTQLHRCVKTRGRMLVVGLGLVSLLMLVPGLASAQSIVNVTFMRDDATGQPGDVVSSFLPTDHTIHVRAQLDQVVVNPNAHATWTAVDTSAGNNIVIADAPMSGAITNELDAQLSLPQDFPVGTYQVDFYLNDQILDSAQFQVANN